MNKRTRCLSQFLCFMLFISTLTGCYDSVEIEDLAYVIAIGIDEGESNTFNLTFQLAVPKAISTGEGESTDILSFKAENFLSGLKKTSEYLSRKINLSHTKIIVVSENIAEKGVTPFLNGIQEVTEIRPDVHIIVASEGAKEYIESVQPKLTTNPSKYYELLFKSYEADFLVPTTQLEEYLYRAKNYGAQPLAIYTGINEDINETKPSEEESKKPEDGDKKPEKKNMTLKGLAVFKMDKMIGKLVPSEASLYSLLTGINEHVTIQVTDPLDKRFKVLSVVTREKASNTKVKIINNKPQIDINLKLKVDVQAVQSDNDYDDPQKAVQLKKAYEDYINDSANKLLRKITKDYKSDIFGFGEFAKRNYKTIYEWEQAKWPQIFEQSEYNLNVELGITRKG